MSMCHSAVVKRTRIRMIWFRSALASALGSNTPKLLRIGINAELLLLMRSPNIDKRMQRDVLHILLCRTFEQN